MLESLLRNHVNRSHGLLPIETKHAASKQENVSSAENCTTGVVQTRLQMVAWHQHVYDWHRGFGLHPGLRTIVYTAFSTALPSEKSAVKACRTLTN